MSSRRRVLVLTSTLPRFAGDTEPRFVLDLSKELQETYDVTLLAPADPRAGREEILEGIRVVRYRYAPLRAMETLAYPGAILPRLKQNAARWLLVPPFVLGQYRAAARLLRQEHYDCIHAHWLLPQGVVAHRLFRRFNVPYIVTSHGADIFALDSPFGVALKRKVMQHAGRITVVSRAILERIVADTRLQTVAERLEIIPMGVDLDAFHPSKRDEGWPRRVGLGAPLVLFVGRLAEKKGVTFLLQAMALEPLRSSPVSLAIIGDGSLRTELEGESRRLGIRSKVSFLGALTHAQAQIAYASADIFCLPSVVAQSGDREGLPTVLCEAAASALPVVSTSVSGIGEIVRDGITGVLVAERDPVGLSRALMQLAADPERRAIFAAASRRQAESFSWSTVGERFRVALDAAIDAHRADSSHVST